MLSCNFKWIYTASIAALIVASLLPNLVNIDLLPKCDLSAKPFIYGEELCSVIGNITVSSNNLLTSLIYMFSSKFTVKAKIGQQNIYLKKLAYYYELDGLDRYARETFDSDKLDSFNLTHVPSSVLSSVFIPFKSTKTVKLRLCPSAQKISNLLVPVIENYRRQNLSEDLIHFYIWTVLHVNPEPFILQILTGPEWPVPQYLGSCGRLAAFQDCGERLTEHYHSSWLVRANLTLQILTAAMQFTLGHPQFGFYLTDLTPDNIAVDDQGVARFIDLEHLIVVDKDPAQVTDENLVWLKNHSSAEEKCTDFYSCFTFSPDDICLHKFSDHNVFAVCREILDDSSTFLDGFLHSTPQIIRTNFPQLRNLIRKCISPSEEDRFSLASQLISSLSRAVSLLQTSS